MNWSFNSHRKRAIKKRLAKEQDYRCWLCGVRRSIRTFTLDHVQPRRFGRCDKFRNLKLACLRCNSDRGIAVNNLVTKGFYRQNVFKRLEQLIVEKHVENIRNKRNVDYK